MLSDCGIEGNVAEMITSETPATTLSYAAPYERSLLNLLHPKSALWIRYMLTYRHIAKMCSKLAEGSPD